MRKQITFCFMMILAVLLALPIYSIAQSKLILDSGGSRIGGATIQSFSMGTDGTVVFYLSSGFPNKIIKPDIWIDQANCSFTSPATISANQGSTIQFRVNTDTGLTLKMVVNPDEGTATFPDTAPNGTFTWVTTGVSPLPYLAVFEACQGTCPNPTPPGENDFTSQLVVWININPPETVSTPTVSGPSTGNVGVDATFTAQGSSVTPSGDPVQYQIDCGNGTNSGWLLVGTASYGCKYTNEGQFSVTAKAHCSVHTGVESLTSSSATINISTVPTYTLTVNVTPTNGGTVTLNPPGGTYTQGTSVQLTAVPNTTTTPPYSFFNWSGALSGTDLTKTLVMDGPKSVTATFGQEGAYRSIVNTATPIQAWDSQCGMYSVDFGIGQNQTLYFLIDTKGWGWPYLTPNYKFSIFDQYQNANINYPTVLKIDGSYNLVNTYPMTGAGGFTLWQSNIMSRSEWDSGYKLLIKIHENGTGNATGLKARWGIF